jgi:uncharacterized repeat protein (TIGR03803 family)
MVSELLTIALRLPAQSPLVQWQDNCLYGTTYSFGIYRSGTIYRVESDGSQFTVMYNFTAFHYSRFANPDGAYPKAPLLIGQDDALYGTASEGGGNGTGAIFKFDPEAITFTMLHSFAPKDRVAQHNRRQPTNLDGIGPDAALIQGPDGTLYGTTAGGGGYGIGTIFKLRPDGTGFQILHTFGLGASAELYRDYAFPEAALLLGKDGALYGATYFGGKGGGTIFKLQTDGAGFRVLHSFDHETGGSCPKAALIQGPDGALYGTTQALSTVFKLQPDGSGYTTLHRFREREGYDVYAPLLLGRDGALYGVASTSGKGSGTVFKLRVDGTGFKVLHTFSKSDKYGYNLDGSQPQASLFQDQDGTLYGVSMRGGTYGVGTIFKLKPNGRGFTVIHTF